MADDIRPIESTFNTAAAGKRSAMSKETLADGGFVITWESPAPDGSGSSLFGRRYRPDNTPDGPAFRVGSHITASPGSSKIVALADGGFIIVWETGGQDGHSPKVYSQRYTADGQMDNLANSHSFPETGRTGRAQAVLDMNSLTDGEQGEEWRNPDAERSRHSLYEQLRDADNTLDGSALRIDTPAHGGWNALSISILFGEKSGAIRESAGQEKNDSGTDSGAGSEDLSPVFIPGQDNSFIGTDDEAARDWIYGDAQDNMLFGLAGDDILEGGGGADTIDGGEGWDYARYTRSAEGVQINLETGVHTGGDAQGDVLIGIEAVVGSAYDDTLTGADGKDYLRGGDGNDTLDGGGGTDQLFGEEGNDTYLYSAGRDTIHEQGSGIDRVVFDPSLDPLSMTITVNSFIFNAGVDEVIFNNIGLIEIFSFDGYADMTLAELLALKSGATDPGTSGDDLLIGTASVQSFSGMDGLDTVDYSLSAGAVLADLLAGTGTGGDAAGDSFISIENIIGADNATVRDRIYGDAQDNMLFGLAGDDILEGGGGADTIDGGEGWDYARYTRSAEGVQINLETGVHTGGDAQGDVLIGIEAVIGSAYDDTLLGGASADYLNGGNGDDLLAGGGGADQLYGGNGADVFLFEAATAFDHIDLLRDFDPAEGDRIDISGLLQEYDPVADAIADFVQITESGGKTTISVDADGGGDAFVPIATITGLLEETDERALEAAGVLIT